MDAMTKKMVTLNSRKRGNTSVSKIKQFIYGTAQSSCLPLRRLLQKDVVLSSQLPETVSLQHLSLFIACPVISTPPVSVSCCGTGEGKAALTPAGEKEDAALMRLQQ